MSNRRQPQEKPSEMDLSHTTSTVQATPESWDDSSIESEDGTVDGEEVYAIRVSTDKEQKSSDLRCYKEITSYRRWFKDHVASHVNGVCATSKVAELCGISMKIYYLRVDEERQRRRRRRHSCDELPVNKVATMLTFHPNTGLYDHLIRSKAYIVIGDGRTKTPKRTVWMLQELISEYKGKYHEFGADFSREGQMELLKACVQFKKGKWVPRSVYGMALTSTPDDSWSQSHHDEGDEVSLMKKEEEEGPMKRSSASHWFISAYAIEDMQGPAATGT